MSELNNTDWQLARARSLTGAPPSLRDRAMTCLDNRLTGAEWIIAVDAMIEFARAECDHDYECLPGTPFVECSKCGVTE